MGVLHKVCQYVCMESLIQQYPEAEALVQHSAVVKPAVEFLGIEDAYIRH